MTNPLKDRLIQARTKIGISQGELAKKLGIHLTTLSKYENGHRIPDVEILCQLSNICQVDPAWLLTGQQPESAPKTGKRYTGLSLGEEGLKEPLGDMNEFVFVPRYDVNVFAGDGGVVDQELVQDVLAYRLDFIRDELGISNKSLAVITVSGNSMEPEICAGDTLLVNLADKNLTSDGIYVINYDGGLVVKRVEVRFDTETILLKSDNKEYSPQEITPDRASQLNVVGKAVLVSKRV
jgi:phage repressor protein C with HTH and peptisase S24 domain